MRVAHRVGFTALQRFNHSKERVQRARKRGEPPRWLYAVMAAGNELRVRGGTHPESERLVSVKAAEQ